MKGKFLLFSCIPGILSETHRNYVLNVEFEDGSKQTITAIEEQNKVDGYFSYYYNFQLKPDEKLKIYPQSEEMLFKPDYAEFSGKAGEWCFRI